MLPLRIGFLLIVGLVGLAKPVRAQLSANFTASQTGGCSPISVSFTNTTQGASTNATYSWNYGNNNQVTTPDSTYSSGATYTIPGTYTVTLTVTDGGQVSTQTQTITVYNNPGVGFALTSGASGCAPLNSVFQSNSIAGSGSISTYYWDFGDGTTTSGTSSSVSHAYTFSGTPTVQLTVTNSYGCSASLAQAGLVTVGVPLVPAFSADSTSICTLGHPVQFSNLSTGPPTISYTWEFGDGSTSTLTTPSHTYSNPGTYSVTLLASSTAGCSDSVQLTNYIKVAQDNPAFSLTSPVCQGSTLPLSDLSSPAPNPGSEVWTISNDTAVRHGASASLPLPNPGSYTVTMLAMFGSCPASLSLPLTVLPGPSLNGFTVSSDGSCQVPTTYTFTDTSGASVAWDWYESNGSGTLDSIPFATAKSSSFIFSRDTTYQIGLTIKTANGCLASVLQNFNIQAPTATMTITNLTDSTMISCVPITVKCSAKGNPAIVKYLWSFGDGTTSTDSTPTHSYSALGNYEITLSYVNANGCTGIDSVAANNHIQIISKPQVNFSILPPNPVCGNTTVVFTAEGGTANYIWNFGDSSTGESNVGANGIMHTYHKEGTYTITLIATGNGSQCRDTVIKVDSVIVLPSFPKILSAANSCAGTRGEVFFKDSVRGATSMVWSFGDGATLSLSAAQDTLTHIYTHSGAYLVKLTSTAGNCVNSDSTKVYVLVKQSPLLQSPRSEVCTDSALQLTVTGLDTNYWAATPGNASALKNRYYTDSIQYWNAYTNQYVPGLTGQTTNISGTISHLPPGIDSLRVILHSELFGCYDTSNILPMVISGPMAGYVVNDLVCYKIPIAFNDTSRQGFGPGIASYLWNFGDGTTSTIASPSHKYTSPGTYYPLLQVTDSSGCTSASASRTIVVNGPKAAFTWTPSLVVPGTTVSFTNTSTGPFDSAWWYFAGDKTTSNSLYTLQHTYQNVLTDTVTLVVYNPSPGYCASDTAVQLVPVQTVSAVYVYSLTYVSGNNCPPALVQFNATMTNVTNWTWNFGDGATSVGMANPSHTYNKPGNYVVTLTATGPGATVVVVDSILIKGPYATVTSSLEQACVPATATLSAKTTNAVAYTWDFGDGTLIQGGSMTQSHLYTIPGIYTPNLILTDSIGCRASFSPGDSILIDTLYAQATAAPAHVCDSGLVSFDPQVYSLASQRAGEELSYHWYFGDGSSADTSDVSDPSFRFTKVGTFTVHLTVTSPPGCTSQALDTILVTRSDKGIVQGPLTACAGDSLYYSAIPTFADTLHWSWTFPNSTGDTGAKAPVFVPTQGGTDMILLVSNLDGCLDTTIALLTVSDQPIVTFTPANPMVCLGSSVQVTAGGGIQYQWNASTGLSAGSSFANALVQPPVTMDYDVTVTGTNGCKRLDSVLVTVIDPFTMNLPLDTFVCIGDSIQLDPSGAYHYQWIGGSPISDPGSATPWVYPLVNTTYTVVGTDRYGCFSDTGSVSVDVEPLPSVQTVGSLTIPAGNTVTLEAIGSANVTHWSWSPAVHLSCSDCASPAATPDSNMVYTVTAYTQYGCASTDTVRINLVCHEENVVIPTAFTPNNDGINDYFYPMGKGAKIVSSFLIYGRWGNLVFERHNIPLNDISNAWDGKAGGIEQPVGAYIYFLEIICDTGDKFTKKGTVLLER
jgi:gliding motility-associated-like protein